MPKKKTLPTSAPANAANLKAVNQISAALDSLALARDFALTIESGEESPHDFEVLAAEVRQAICEAGKQLEEGLCTLGLLPANAKSGWFVPELQHAVA